MGLEMKAIVKQGRSVREFADIYRRYADGEIDYPRMLELSRQNRGPSRPPRRWWGLRRKPLIKRATV